MRRPHHTAYTIPMSPAPRTIPPRIALPALAIILAATIALAVGHDSAPTAAQSGPTASCGSSDLHGRSQAIVDGLEVLFRKPCADFVANDFTRARTLWFDRNGISEIRPGDFDGFTQVTTLNLRWNDLTTLPDNAFRGLTALTTLRLNNNKLTSFNARAFSGLTNVRTMDMTENDLTTLQSRNFAGMSSLRTLILTSNSINTLPDDAFSSLPALEHLRLGDNYLASDDLDFLATNIPTLTDLSLDENLITSDGSGPDLDLPATVFSAQTALEDIRLEQNAIKELPSGIFSALPSLHTVYLNSNRLSALGAGSFSGSTSLATLLIDDNVITTIAANTFAGMTSLRWIDLRNNRLTQLPAGLFTDNTALRTIDFSQNQLSEVPADLLSGPKTYADTLMTVRTTDRVSIYLNDNMLSSLPSGLFTGVKTLYRITLEENQITTLPADTFNGLNELYSLNIQENRLSALPAGLLAGLSDLCPISLHTNQLTEIPAGFFDDVRTSSWCRVQLYGNNFSSTEQARLQGVLGSRAIFQTPASSERTVHETTDNAEDLANCGTGPLHGRTRKVVSNIMSGIPSAVRTPLTGLPTDSPAKCSAITTEHLKLVSTLTLTSRITRFQANDLADLPNLEYVAFSSYSPPRVTSLPAGFFNNLPKLRILYLNGSYLRTLPRGIFDGLTNLRELRLNYNLLTTLPNGIFRDLVNLRTLFLNQNQLSSLPPGVFAGLQELRTLALYINEFDQDDFPEGTFNGLTKLRTLRMAVNNFESLPLDRFANQGLNALKRLEIGTVTQLPSDFELSEFQTALPSLREFTFPTGSVVREAPATPTPTATATPTLHERLQLPVVAMVAPEIRNLSIRSGDQIRLSIAIYDVQNVRDDTLSQHEAIRIEWGSADGGDISSIDSGGTTDPRMILWQAPNLPGQYTVTASIVPDWACSGEAHECTATFTIRVIRGAHTPTPEPTPCPTSGIVPTSVTDTDGNAYTTITPAEGGEFVDERASVSVPRGAIIGCTYFGVRLYSLTTESRTIYPGWTIAGSRYRADIVDVRGANLSNLALGRPASICVPLPTEFRASLTGITLLRQDGDSVAQLTTSVRLHPERGYTLCGKVSTLPAAVVAASPGSGTGADLPSPTPEAETPDTGGNSPTNAYILLALILGAAAVFGAMRIMDTAQRPR